MNPLNEIEVRRTGGCNINSKASVLEWFAEIEGLEPQDDGYTVMELVDISGRDEKFIRRFLRAGLRQGVVVLGFAQRSRIDGQAYRANVYRFKPETRELRAEI